MKPIVWIVFGLAIARPADARNWGNVADRLQGGAYLHYELSGWTALADDDPAVTRPPDLVLAGARIGGFVGKGPTLGYYLTLDLFAGSTLDGAGFAYDVALQPIGIAVRFGATGIAGVTTGIAASGAVGTIDDAVLLPVSLAIEAGRGWRVLARARIAYVAGANGRQDGAPHAPFADELDAQLGLRFGRSYDRHRFPSGNGYFVAAAYREQVGARFVGVTIGYSLDVALRRRFRSREVTSR